MISLIRNSLVHLIEHKKITLIFFYLCERPKADGKSVGVFIIFYSRVTMKSVSQNSYKVPYAEGL